MSMSPVLFARSAWSSHADPCLMNNTDGAGSNGMVPNKETVTALIESRGEESTLEGMMGYVPHAERVMRVCLSIYRCFITLTKANITFLPSKWRHLFPLLVQANDGYQPMSSTVSNVPVDYYTQCSSVGLHHLICGWDIHLHEWHCWDLGKPMQMCWKSNQTCT